MARNLLKNPSGEEQLEFWDLTENGGSQWKVEDMPGDCGFDFCTDGVTKYFLVIGADLYLFTLTVPWPIFETRGLLFEEIQYMLSKLCLKRQVIDLLAEGYAPEELDNEPAVTVEDWYCGRSDCGCTYQMTVSLLDENQEVMKEFQPERVTLDPDCDDCSWKQVSHTFSEYGPGMRFISFEHGGQDTRYWDGWFGVRVTGSAVTVEV